LQEERLGGGTKKEIFVEEEKGKCRARKKKRVEGKSEKKSQKRSMGKRRVEPARES